MVIRLASDGAKRLAGGDNGERDWPVAMRRSRHRFEDCLWTAGYLDDWTLDDIEPLSHALPTSSFVISSALKSLRIVPFHASVALVHPVMDDTTQTIERQSNPQHSYSEDPNQPNNRPPVGESSSIQRSILSLTGHLRSGVPRLYGWP